MIAIWQTLALMAVSGAIGVFVGMGIMAACAAAHYDDDMQGRE